MKRNRFKQRCKAHEAAQKPLLQYLRETYALDSGHAEIRVDLRQAELYDPFSVGAQTDLTQDLYDYIDRKVYPVPTGIPVKLILTGVPASERKTVASLLREHYDLQLRDKKLDLRLNRLRSGSLFLIGALLFAGYFLLEAFIDSAVWHEILSIIATVVVWEASEKAFIERHDLKREHAYAAQAAMAEICFSETEIQEVEA